MHKVELLLPAGNWDCLKAAVENGADAVYLGIDKFNARRRAENFNFDNIEKAVNYAHENGVRVYCTLNILIKNNELKDYFNTIQRLYLAGIDAVIIQHLSFLPIIKHNFPGLEVHISTQAAITNSYWKELIKQADKIVLPREYSKEEIMNFVQKTKLSTEVFIQGAQCFSYSGKCLFSSMIFCKSGNRGLCLQPCRKKYNDSYLLSMKDLCLLQKIPELINIGVSSLKVEGRLRSPKYVAAATKTYRQAIDSYYAGKFSVDLNSFKEMELAFNREFTFGYYNLENELISPERPMGRGQYLGTLEKGNFILLKEELNLGDGVGIWLKNKVDGAIIRDIELKGKKVKNAVEGDYIKLFIHAPIGTKIYKTSSVKEQTKIKFIKNKSIVIQKRYSKEIILPKIINQKLDQELLIVKAYNKKDADLALKKADIVFYNIFANDFDVRYGAYLPRILNDKEVEKVIEIIDKLQLKNILIGDLGAYALLKDRENLNLYLDYSCNVFNDFDLLFFENCTPIVSPEISLNEIKEFKNKSFACFVHGRIVLMNTKYTLLPKLLKDEKRYIFPTRKEHNYYQILNSKELGLFEEVNKLKNTGIKIFYLDLDSNVDQTLNNYINVLKDNKKNRIDKNQFTKGHFLRGVD